MSFTLKLIETLVGMLHVMNMDLSEILQLYYPSDTLLDVPTALDSDVPYFRLVVKVAGSDQVININFNLVSE